MKYYIILLSIFLTGRLAAQSDPIWSLQDCIDYAVSNNITVKKTILDKQTAAINYKQQKDNKLPSVSGSGSFNTSRGSTIDPITSSFLNQTISSNSYGINAQMVLYQGNSLNLQIEKNELLVQQSALYQKEAENNIKLSVIESYLQVLYYNEGITIAKNAAASSAEELSQARVKFANGAIAQLDLADLETQHATNEYNVVAAQNQYAQQLLQLKQLLELDPSESFNIKPVALIEELKEIPDKQTVFSIASQTLPDIKLFDAQEDILKKELEITKTGYKPTLSLNGGLNSGYTNTMNMSFIDQIHGNFSQQIGLTLSIPIFSKYQNKNNVALSKINIQQNQLNKTAASKTLYSTIETAWQNAVANQTQQVSAKTTRDNAELAYNLARKKFDFGGLTTTELSVSRNSYLTAEQTYLQSKYLAVLYSSLLDFYQNNNSNSSQL